MKIGFIGTGNMGGILAQAVAGSTMQPTVFLADRDREKAGALAEKIGAQVVDNKRLAEHCDVLFLGVKPQVLPAVAAELKPVLQARNDRFLLVTMAAGVSTEQLSRLLDGAYPTVRIMPNTPAAVGKGLILYTSANGVSETELSDFTAYMAPAGSLLPIAEDKIDAAGAVSGCGPAFVYLFLEALADGGVACGLSRETALACAAETVRGAADMVLQTKQHPAVLKDAVCSPAGTTVAGVEALEKGKFRATAFSAVKAAYERTLELK